MKRLFDFSFIFVIGIVLIAPPLDGQTWTATKRLTWTSGGSHNPAVAGDSNDFLYVVWSDYVPGPDEIYLKKSTDGGVTWKTKRLTWSIGYSYSPAISIDTNDHIHVVWYDNTNWASGKYEIYYKKSTNGGATWSSTKRLSWNSGYSQRPAIATDSNNHVHVVWIDDTPGNMELFYKKSTNAGVSWSGAKRLTWLPGSSVYPAICTDVSDNVHIAWHDDNPGNWEIFYKKSTDGGTTWKTKRLSWDSYPSQRAAITADTNGHIHIVWRGLNYRKSTDGGTTWTPNKLISGGVEGSISVSSLGNIYVAFKKTDDDIYYSKSTNSGADWTSAKRLTWNSGKSQYPELIVDSGEDIHIVWQDETPGNFEIFYRKGIQ